MTNLSYNKIKIPYKNHSNKVLWDFMSKFCEQINNINLSDSIDSDEASFSNICYLVIDDNKIYLTLGFSQQNIVTDNVENVNKFEDLKHYYKPFYFTWAKLQDCTLDYDVEGIKIFSLDIKKYNSTLSFAKSYQNRDNIYISFSDSLLYFEISDNKFVDVSAFPVLDSEKISIITDSLNKYNNLNSDDSRKRLVVRSVDKNSFLLPYMSYKNFLNFSVFSAENNSRIVYDSISSTYHIVNYLFDYIYDQNKEDYDLLYYSDILLRKDKFDLLYDYENYDLNISVGFWQILIFLQQYKSWSNLCQYLDHSVLYFNKTDAFITFIYNCNLIEKSSTYDYDTLYGKDDYELVGILHSDELFKLNKLYSNANRSCFFDFSDQTFYGNNYVFNKDYSTIEKTKLENNIDTKIPLRMTFTELKHYIGSDLSQKHFTLLIYTDGIRVILERYYNKTTECKILFNHLMSKKNQNLPII